jgi:glycosyltransferase involved in cell wall biosynthesis
MGGDPVTVAVITRTKDRPLLLGRAIRSVMQQTLGDLHMVVVNDGGHLAAVEEVAARYEHIIGGRLSIVHHPVSLGMEAASNAGIAAFDSRYLALLDDDDSWHPRFLEETVNAMAASGNPGAVTATRLFVERVDGTGIRLLHSVTFTSDTHLVRTRPEGGTGIGARVAEMSANRPLPTSLFRLLEANQFTSNAFVYERAAREVVGPYDETLPVLGDWDFNLRFLRHFDVDYVDLPLAYYHHRQAGPSDMANTVTDPGRSHDQVRRRLLNRYLRADLEEGRLGMGYLANLQHADRDRAAFLRAAYDDLQDGLAGLADELRAAGESSRTGVATAAQGRMDELDRHLSQLEGLVGQQLSADAAERRAVEVLRRMPGLVKGRAGRALGRDQ